MMPVPSPEVLSLHTMTGLLQSACLAEPASRAEILLDQAPSLLALTTPEMEADLSFDMVRTLDRLRHGHLSHTDQAMKALALLTARIGEMETARARDVGDEAASVSVRDGINQLLAGKEFHTRPMPKAFLATMEDPRQGFEPLRTANGTDIAFFRSPEELGEPWRDMMASHWQKGVGLVVYRNQRTNTYGMVFLHTLGKVDWVRNPNVPSVSPPRRRIIESGPKVEISEDCREAWQASGGTMAFPHSRLGFAQALERTIDKAVAMTWKWRAVDESLLADGQTPTGLGGSKGLVIHDEGDEAKENALRVYGEVIDLLGATLTGSDEGMEPRWADFLASQAPYNTNGSRFSIYGGRIPTEWTAKGVFRGVEAVYEELGLDPVEAPLLLEGYGGTGKGLADQIRSFTKIPLAGIIERDLLKLEAVRFDGHRARRYVNTEGRAPMWLERLTNLLPSWIPVVRRKARLADIMRDLSGLAVYSPDAGPHSLDFAAAAALIEAGALAVVGSANNQNGLDASGSEIPIAWILQAAGIFHVADFVINRFGATAVSSETIGLTDGAMEAQSRRGADSVRDQYRHAYLKGISPYLYELNKARRAWDAVVASGRGLGGV